MGAKKSIIISEDLKLEIIKIYTESDYSTTAVMESKIFKGSKVTLVKYLKEWEVFKNRLTRLDEYFDAILEKWLNGESLCSLLKEFKVNKSSISKKLKELGYIVTNSQLELKFNEHIFDCIDTEEKAYWLGFIFADGYIRTVNDTFKLTEYGFGIFFKKNQIQSIY